MVNKIRFFFKLFALTFLIAGVGLFLYSSKGSFGKLMPTVKPDLKSVKGESTKRAGEIYKNVSQDIASGGATVKKQVLNIKIGDIVGFASRLQKIPQDAQNIQAYIKEQVDNVLKSKK